jgi:hypothetical protein
LIDGQRELSKKWAGEAFGEMALLSGEPRSTTVIAETDLDLWRIKLDDFNRIIESSPALEAAVRDLSEQHRKGLEIAHTARYDPDTWRGRAIRSLMARKRGPHTWQTVMGLGLLLWVVLFLNERGGWLKDTYFDIGIMVVYSLS